MPGKNLATALITILFITTDCAAQGESAVPFLLISPYAETNGMGQASVAMFTDDPLAAIDNPAHLGMQSLRNYFSSGYNYNRLLPGFQQSNLWYRTFAFNAGMNQRKLFGIEPEMAFGMGYSRIYENLGDFIAQQGGQTFTAYETADQYTFGVGIDYWIKASAGITFKHILSDLGVYYGSGPVPWRLTATDDAYDYGLLVDVPCVEVFSRLRGEPFQVSRYWSPIFNFRLGFANNNLGNNGVVYIDRAHPDPLPRYARIGIGFNLGILYKNDKVEWRPVSFRWTIEANDILVRRYPEVVDTLTQQVLRDSYWEYQGGLGDINFFDEVILGRANTQTIKKKGWEITIGGLFSWRGGRFEEDPNHGNRRFSTMGLGFRTPGITKLIEVGNVLGFILKHVDIQYDHSELTTDEVGHPLSGTKFDSMQIIVSN